MQYKWITDRTIQTLPLDKYQQLVEAAGVSKREQATIATDPDAVIPIGGRTKHIERLAGSQRRFGVSLEAALRLALDVNSSRRFEAPLAEAKVRDTVQGIYGRYPDGIAAGRVRGSSAAPRPDSEHDVGNPQLHRDHHVEPDDHGVAREFIAGYGDRFRNVNESGNWIYCRGGRWYEGAASKQARQAMVRTIKALPALVEDLDPDDPYRKNVLKFAATKTKKALRDNALNLAESEPEMMISVAELDQKPLLLACKNGTLDLATGQLRDHDPRDLLTKGSPVHYDPDARAPRFARFLDEIFPDDPELVAYIQRLCGYSLTGLATVEQLWVLYGEGGNGKSKFVSAFQHVLGVGDDGLAKTADFASFTYRKNEHIPSDIARLDRARLVVALEKSRARALDESVIKKLTGGDRIVARYLHQNEFEFQPQFKLWLACNQRPKVNAADGGIRRRVKMIPFQAHFRVGQNADENLLDKLKAEATGILAWAVQGCLAWQREGLGACGAVDETTEAYLHDMHPLAGFLDERCTLEQGATVKSAELQAAYKEWRDQQADQRGLPALRELKTTLCALDGIEWDKGRSGAIFYGITLKKAQIAFSPVS